MAKIKRPEDIPENERRYVFFDKDLGIPYQPFIEALQHYVAHAPDEVLRNHVADHGGELSRLVPSLLRKMPDCPPASTTDPDTERYLTFGAVTGLMQEACRHSPVVLVLDDLHWADQSSVAISDVSVPSMDTSTCSPETSKASRG